MQQHSAVEASGTRQRRFTPTAVYTKPPFTPTTVHTNQGFLSPRNFLLRRACTHTGFCTNLPLCLTSPRAFSTRCPSYRLWLCTLTSASKVLPSFRFLASQRVPAFCIQKKQHAHFVDHTQSNFWQRDPSSLPGHAALLFVNRNGGHVPPSLPPSPFFLSPVSLSLSLSLAPTPCIMACLANAFCTCVLSL